MRTTYSETISSRATRAATVTFERANLVRLIPISLIVALAAALRFYNLWALGYGNQYYAAGVEAMLQSWHNFFFVAAEPGGSVTIDKPPVGFWLQAISAHFFGVNSLGLVLPQILAGIASVVVVYHLVKRSFGVPAGLLAALALAITPVAVATDRNNTIDSTLVLTLLLAAWAFIVATERKSLRHLLLGAALVGLGFNIKMMEAYLPLPAFYALYFLGSADRLLSKVGKLALASLVLVIVSFAWITVVDLTPADQRPYVGSSGDNSEMSLAIGYNGVERLLGMGRRGGPLSGLSGLFGGAQSGGFPGGARQGAQGSSGQLRQPPTADGGFGQRGQSGDGRLQPGQQGDGGFQPGSSGGFGGGGMFNTGQPGALRLFTQPLSKEMSWLLPFGLFGAVVLAARRRPRWPIAPKHRALVLWGGWLLTGGIFFSVAGFFHQYYLTTLGPPLAALVGIGTAELWGIRKQHPWIGTVLVAVGAAGTVAFQLWTARTFAGSVWWTVPTVVILAIGVTLLAASTRREWSRAGVVGIALVVVSILITPGIWSGLTSVSTSTGQMLPEAYSGRSFGFAGGSPGRGFDGGTTQNQALISYLEANTQGTKYLVAVDSANQGAPYVLATGRPVLYMGGFSGQDQVVTPESLSEMAASGQLKYILWGGGRGFGGGQSGISSWITANCTPVQGVTAQGGGFGGGGTLYQVNSTTGK